jgi:hypothetical protein
MKPVSSNPQAKLEEGARLQETEKSQCAIEHQKEMELTCKIK